MKILFSLLFSIFSFAIHTQNWLQIMDFSGSARDDGTSFKINNVVFCGTGRDAGFAVTSDFKAFDLNSETWSPIASLPDSVKRQYATSFVFNDEGYLFGGINSTGDFFNDLWKYSPILDQWNFVSNLPSFGRSGALSFVIGSKAYVVGGKTALSLATNELWEFDLSILQWTQKNDLPMNGIWRGVGFTYDTTAFVGLGKDQNDALNTMFYHYLPTLDQWQSVSGLILTPRYYVCNAQIGDSVYLYGGIDQWGDYTNTFERINIESLTVDLLNDFPNIGRKGVMAFTSDENFYITTGITQTTRLKETWVARDVVSLEDIRFIEVNVYQVESEIHISSKLNWDQIEIISMDGRVLKSQNLNLEPKIEIDGVKSGIYIYHLFHDGKIASGRIYLN